jgi:hypothetical protein
VHAAAEHLAEVHKFSFNTECDDDDDQEEEDDDDDDDEIELEGGGLQ